MIRWGIVGTGGVSSLFMEAAIATDGATVTAVASRTRERANDFAEQWNIPHRQSGPSALDWWSDVDAVYVATPPALHHAHTLAALNAGKHVLCEKPLATNAQEAEQVRFAAQTNGVFLMEAMWCRFLPAYTRLRELLDQRYVGDIVSVEASFGITQPNRRRSEWNAELGGGALLTGGVYAVQLVSLIMGGPPVDVRAYGICESGVDTSWAAQLLYRGGIPATVQSAITTDLSCQARINGTESSLVLPSVHSPTVIGTQEFPMPAHRLLPEVEHVHECIAAGLLESPVMPLAESVAVAETMDRIRACL